MFGDGTIILRLEEEQKKLRQEVELRIIYGGASKSGKNRETQQSQTSGAADLATLLLHLVGVQTPSHTQLPSCPPPSLPPARNVNSQHDDRQNKTTSD